MHKHMQTSLLSILIISQEEELANTIKKQMNTDML